MNARDQRLFDDVVSNALDVLRLSARRRAEVLKRLQAMEAEMIKRLKTSNLGGNSRRETEKFVAASGQIIDRAYGEVQTGLDEPTTARMASDGAATALEVALGGHAVKLPTKDYFASLASDILIQGAPSADWWRGQSEDLKLKFAAQLRQGLANGETNDELVNRIVGKAGVPGVMDIARRNADTLVHTSVQTVANDARRATFDANEDVVKGLRQVSTLDSHTSIICVTYSGAEWDNSRKPINGNTLPYKGGTPRHWKCRSVEIPILKTFKELGLNVEEPVGTTRASVDGQVPVDTTFDGFLKRKGEVYQEQVLGEGRADLWRAGKITLRDLVDGHGNPLSLEELRAMSGDKFSGAEFFKRYDDANVTPESVLATFPKDTISKIEATQAKLAKLVSTEELHSVSGIYSEERQALHRKIMYEGVQGRDPDTGGTKFYPGLLNAKVLASATNDAKPTFTILGGRGGSGKSAFNGKKFPEAKVYDADKVLVLDADVIKHMLPEFEGYNANQVHSESGYILEQALNEARDFKANVVLDGTLKTSALDKVQRFIQAGYRTEAHYMSLPRGKAAARAVERYLGPTGRYVPASVILANTENEANFDELRRLVNNWSFRDNDVPRGTPPRLVAEKDKPT